MVDPNIEEDKQDQAASQQCSATSPMSDRDLVVEERDMDIDVDHAAKGSYLGTPK